jgi:hypothetical protein
MDPSKAAIFKTRKELGGFAPINVLFFADRKPVEMISHQRSMIVKPDEPNTSLQPLYKTSDLRNAPIDETAYMRFSEWRF